MEILCGGAAILLAQLPDFKETANTFGLAVAILISVAGILLLAIVTVVRWAKPRAEKLIDSHLETMETFRKNDNERTKSLGSMAINHIDSTRVTERLTKAIEEQNDMIHEQGKKLDEMNEHLRKSVVMKAAESAIIRIEKPAPSAGG